MRFFDQVDGTEVDNIIEDLDNSIEELKLQLRMAVEFKIDFLAGKIEDGREYLSFTRVLEHGYDRTGPSPVIAHAEEER